jgi:hypothetical protein
MGCSFIASTVETENAEEPIAIFRVHPVQAGITTADHQYPPMIWI